MRQTTVKGIVAAFGLLLAIGFVPLSGAVPSAPQTSHNPYVDNFVNSNDLSNYKVIQGSMSGWQIDANTIQAIQAGQILELNAPGVNLAGDRLMSLEFLAENIIGSLFYGGFTQNIANLIDTVLGNGLDILKLRVNIPMGELQLLSSNDNLLQQVPLNTPVEFNTLHSEVIHVVGSAVTVSIDGASPLTFNHVNVPAGTIGFAQPFSNTGRAEFGSLQIYTAPDVPTDVAAYPGANFNTVTINWNQPNADGGFAVLGYTVFRGTSPENLQPIAVLGAGENSFTDSPSATLGDMTPYYYAVQAHNVVGLGPMSSASCSQSSPVGLVMPANAYAPSNLDCGTHSVVGSGVLESY